MSFENVTGIFPRGDENADFAQLSEMILKAVEEEIVELNKEKIEYEEKLKLLKESQKRQEEAFCSAEAALRPENYLF